MRKSKLSLLLILVFAAGCTSRYKLDEVLLDVIVGEVDGLSIIDGKSQEFKNHRDYIGDGITYDTFSNCINVIYGPRSPEDPFYLLESRIKKSQSLNAPNEFKLFPSYHLSSKVKTEDMYYTIAVRDNRTREVLPLLAIHEFGAPRYEARRDVPKIPCSVRLPYYFDITLSPELIVPLEIKSPFVSSNEIIDYEYKLEFYLMWTNTLTQESGYASTEWVKFEIKKNSVRYYH